MLAPGTRFGPYEITSLLGAGGMGEVYRAKDLRLKRDVALKILPPSLASDPGRIARFQREAEVLAALDHPHIGAIYGSEVSNDLIALVLQLVEGETLADRIARGPLPVDEALHIARQIAQALAAAHAQGVIHRDLKPANISITGNNTVKVLDFGLAKLTDAPGVAAAASSLSPTMTSPAMLTGAEVLLGTAAYMSPEQARGKAVDKRADVWAFGCLLYEMLTGERLHQGETVSETVAAVLKESPDLTRVPPRLRRVLRSCLQKDPERRLHDVADWQLLIDDDDIVVQDRQAPSRGWLWSVAAGALLLIAAIALGVVLLRQPAAIPERSEAQIPQPPGLTFVPGTQATMSPDGRWLAFPSIGPDNISRMYIRSVSSLEVRPLPGSEGISNNSPPPFWSYDSRYVIYNAGGRLKKNETTGTPAQPIGDVGFGAVQGGTANEAGTIVYGGANRGLQQIPLAGGKPAPVTVLAAGETAQRFPQFLPDGRRFLYLRVGSPEATGVYLGSLDVAPDKQDMKMLLPTNRQAWWVMSERTGSAFLLMQREETLFAQPFDLKTATLSGTPTPVANGVGSFAGATAGLWSASRNGALTYRAGGSGLPLLTWRDFKGQVLGTVGEPSQLGPFNLSPDGSRVAYRLTDIRGNQDIYVHELKSNISSKFAFSPDIEDNPVWSYDSKKIFFSAMHGNRRDLYEKNADGTGEERVLFQSDAPKAPLSASDDGRFLLFVSGGQANADLYLLSLGDGKAFPFVNKTNEAEISGQISPGGKWISYNVLGPSGPELFVRPFPGLPIGNSKPDGSYWAVATGVVGNNPARWTADGRRLIYLVQSGDIMAVDLEDGPAFKIAGPAQPVIRGLSPAPWALDPTGPRVLTQQLPSNSGPPPPFTLLLNWLPQLEQ